MIMRAFGFTRFSQFLTGCAASCLLLASASGHTAVTLESQVKITDEGLHFNGVDHDFGSVGNPSTAPNQYDFFFGRNISAHGDAVKTYKHYVFMTWYRGGKDDRHVMLTRYNTKTGETVDIEFPHRHTGFRGDPLVGESHNTIGLAVSPVNGTIHMVYDMHAYDDNNHSGRFKDDYFRYSYSLAGAADAADEDFTLDLFIKDTSNISQGDDDYKHITMTGDLADKGNFARLTYPQFFVTDEGTLLLYMRLGGNNNGAYVFNRYDAANQKWSKFTKFNNNNQRNFGNAYNWGLYGNMKYLNGKLRVGFQQRSSNNDDKYLFQNGIYYAYSNHAQGFGEWFNYKDEAMTWPLVNSDEIFVYEPGNLVETTTANKVRIVDGFDWTVTAAGDIHFVHKTRNLENNRTVFGHTYKPAGATDFITSTDFAGATEIYTSGDNVYIIGLRSGKPYVEVAKGGTNDFTRVYEADEGAFDHGVVYVVDGKVYYYLMEKVADSNGNKTAISTTMPLYLQIIDLGIQDDLSVAIETSQSTLVEGYDALNVSATPTSSNPDTDIESVALYLDDTLVSTLFNAPYQWTQADTPLANLAVGIYTLKAIATDSAGLSVETTEQLSVEADTTPPTVAFAQNTMSITEDYASLSIGVTANTSNAAATVASIALYLNDVLVTQENSTAYTWTQANAQLASLAPGSYALKAVATDTKGYTAETTMTLTVNQKATVDSSNAASGSSGGGGNTSFAFLLALALLQLVSVRKKPSL